MKGLIKLKDFQKLKLINIKIIEKYFPCQITQGECVQPEKRWGHCSIDQDTGQQTGCSVARGWLKNAMLNAGAPVTIYVKEEEPETLYFEAKGEEWYVSGGVESDIPGNLDDSE